SNCCTSCATAPMRSITPSTHHTRRARMITHLKFAAIPTSDQDRALKLWTEKVGFELQTDQAMGPQRWIELSVRNSNTGIVLWTQEGQEDRIGTFFNGSFAC